MGVKNDLTQSWVVCDHRECTRSTAKINANGEVAAGAARANGWWVSNLGAQAKCPTHKQQRKE